MKKLLVCPSGSAKKGITEGEGVALAIPGWTLFCRDGYGCLCLIWFRSSLAATILSSSLGARNCPTAMDGPGRGAAAQMPRIRVSR